MKRQSRLDRVRAIERELSVASLGCEFLKDGIREEPEVLSLRDLRPRDVDAYIKNLEPTYLVRLFAEFEAALRDLWRNGYRRKSDPLVRTLIDSVAVRCHISPANLKEVHRVRSFRNSVVHEGTLGSAEVEFGEARTALSKFLAMLPLNW